VSKRFSLLFIDDLFAFLRSCNSSYLHDQRSFLL